jgi:hypothetical protein
MRAVIDPLQSLSPGGEVYDAALVGTMGAAINAIPDVCAAAPGILHPTAFAPWRPQKRKAGAIA